MIKCIAIKNHIFSDSAIVFLILSSYSRTINLPACLPVGDRGGASSLISSNLAFYISSEIKSKIINPSTPTPSALSKKAIIITFIASSLHHYFFSRIYSCNLLSFIALQTCTWKLWRPFCFFTRHLGLGLPLIHGTYTNVEKPGFSLDYERDHEWSWLRRPRIYMWSHPSGAKKTTGYIIYVHIYSYLYYIVTW